MSAMCTGSFWMDLCSGMNGGEESRAWNNWTNVILYGKGKRQVGIYG